MKLGRNQFFLLHLIDKKGYGHIGTVKKAMALSDGRNLSERESIHKKAIAILEKLEFLGLIHETNDPDNPRTRIFKLTEAGKVKLSEYRNKIMKPLR